MNDISGSEPTKREINVLCVWGCLKIVIVFSTHKLHICGWWMSSIFKLNVLTTSLDYRWKTCLTLFLTLWLDFSYAYRMSAPHDYTMMLLSCAHIIQVIYSHIFTYSVHVSSCKVFSIHRVRKPTNWNNIAIVYIQPLKYRYQCDMHRINLASYWLGYDVCTLLWHAYCNYTINLVFHQHCLNTTCKLYLLHNY